jgi:hypothetical protein
MPSCREMLFFLLNYELPFLDHVHQLDSYQGVLGCRKRLEAEHGTRDALHRSMVLCHQVMEIRDVADFNRGAVCLVITRDGGFMGVTAVNGHLLRHTVAANRLLQKPSGRLLIPVLREQKINRLALRIDSPIEIAPLAGQRHTSGRLSECYPVENGPP